MQHGYNYYTRHVYVRRRIGKYDICGNTIPQPCPPLPSSPPPSSSPFFSTSHHSSSSNTILLLVSLITITLLTLFSTPVTASVILQPPVPLYMTLAGSDSFDGLTRLTAVASLRGLVKVMDAQHKAMLANSSITQGYADAGVTFLSRFQVLVGNGIYSGYDNTNVIWPRGVTCVSFEALNPLLPGLEPFNAYTYTPTVIGMAGVANQAINTANPIRVWFDGGFSNYSYPLSRDQQLYLARNPYNHSQPYTPTADQLRSNWINVTDASKSAYALGEVINLKFTRIGFRNFNYRLVQSFVTGELPLPEPNMKLAIESCVFAFCTPASALFQYSTVRSLTINNTLIYNITNPYAGADGSFLWGRNVQKICVNNSVFANSTSIYNGGVIAIDNSAISASVNISFHFGNSMFVNNSLLAASVYTDVKAGGYGAALSFIGINSNPDAFLIRNCSFINNTALISYGGAIGLQQVAGAGVQIVGSKFINNTAASGGALALVDSIVKLGVQTTPVYSVNETLIVPSKVLATDVDFVLFDNNKAVGSPSAAERADVCSNFLLGLGGAIVSLTSTKPKVVSPFITVSSAAFTNNKASAGGGALFLRNSRFVSSEGANFTANAIVPSTGQGNGGALFFCGNALETRLEKSNLTRNAVGTGSGGAVYATTLRARSFFMSYNVFDSNSCSGATCNGGGISIQSTRGTTFTRNILIRNEGGLGGAMEVSSDSDAKVENLNCTSNKANFAGGCLYVHDNSMLTSTSNYIAGNTAANIGGAVYLTARSTLIWDTCETRENTAIKDGGGLYLSSASSILLKNCLITNNTARRDGGGVFVSGQSKLNSVSSNITANIAKNNGGGLSMDSSTATFDYSRVSRNTAARNGGGINALSKSSMNFSNNCYFRYNEATAGNGGGLYMSAGGKFRMEYTECTFNNARKGSGGGFYFSQGMEVYLNSLLVSYNTAYKSGGGIYALELSSAAAAVNTLRQGEISHNVAYSQFGGGFYFDSTVNFLFNQTLLWNNSASSEGSMQASINGGSLIGSGGAMYLGKRSNVTLLSVNMTKNNAPIAGGALYVAGSSIVYLNSSSVCSNTAGPRLASSSVITTATASSSFSSLEINGRGGAVYAESAGYLYVSTSTIDRNTARLEGGAMYLVNGFTASVCNSRLRGNKAVGDGGAVLVDKAIFSSKRTDFKLNEAGATTGIVGAPIVITPTEAEIAADYSLLLPSNLIKNSAGGGGAIVLRDYAKGTIGPSTNFLRNSARTSGGAIKMDLSAKITATASNFTSNKAALSGGVLYLNADSKWEKIYGDGNDCIAFSSNFVLTNLTLLDNTADVGGGGIFYFEYLHSTCFDLDVHGNVVTDTMKESAALVDAQQSHPPPSWIPLLPQSVFEPLSLFCNGCDADGNNATYGSLVATGSRVPVYTPSKFFVVYERVFNFTVVLQDDMKNTILGLDHNGYHLQVTMQRIPPLPTYVCKAGITIDETGVNGVIPEVEVAEGRDTCWKNTATYDMDTLSNVPVGLPPDPLDKEVTRQFGIAIAVVTEGEEAGSFSLGPKYEYYDPITGERTTQLTLDNYLPMLYNASYYDFHGLYFTGLIDAPYTLTTSVYDDTNTDIASSRTGVTLVQCGVGQEQQSTGVCASCPVDTFNINNDGVCYACPAEAVCPTPSQVNARKDFWRDTSVPDAELHMYSSMAFHRCLPGDCCPDGGRLPDGREEGCPVETQCANSRDGRVCAVCPNGLQSTLNGICLPCSTDGKLIAPMFFCLMMLPIFCLLFPPSMSASMTLLVTFAQLLPLSGRDNSGFFTPLNFLNFDVFAATATPASCFYTLNPIDGIVVRLGMIFSCWGFFAFLFLLCTVVAAKNWQHYIPYWGKLISNEDQTYIQSFKHALVRLYLFSFIGLSSSCIDLVTCRLIDGVHVLQASPAVECWKGNHWPWAIIAMILLATVIGLPPLYFAYYIYRTYVIPKIPDPATHAVTVAAVKAKKKELKTLEERHKLKAKEEAVAYATFEKDLKAGKSVDVFPLPSLVAPTDDEAKELPYEMSQSRLDLNFDLDENGEIEMDMFHHEKQAKGLKDKWDKAAELNRTRKLRALDIPVNTNFTAGSVLTRMFSIASTESEPDSTRSHVSSEESKRTPSFNAYKTYRVTEPKDELRLAEAMHSPRYQTQFGLLNRIKHSLYSARLSDIVVPEESMSPSMSNRKPARAEIATQSPANVISARYDTPFGLLNRIKQSILAVGFGYAEDFSTPRKLTGSELALQEANDAAIAAAMAESDSEPSMKFEFEVDDEGEVQVQTQERDAIKFGFEVNDEGGIQFKFGGEEEKKEKATSEKQLFVLEKEKKEKTRSEKRSFGLEVNEDGGVQFQFGEETDDEKSVSGHSPERSGIKFGFDVDDDGEIQLELNSRTRSNSLVANPDMVDDGMGSPGSASSSKSPSLMIRPASAAPFISPPERHFRTPSVSKLELTKSQPQHVQFNSHTEMIAPMTVNDLQSPGNDSLSANVFAPTSVHLAKHLSAEEREHHLAEVKASVTNHGVKLPESLPRLMARSTLWPGYDFNGLTATKEKTLKLRQRHKTKPSDMAEDDDFGIVVPAIQPPRGVKRLPGQTEEANSAKTQKALDDAAAKAAKEPHRSELVRLLQSEVIATHLKKEKAALDEALTNLSSPRNKLANSADVKDATKALQLQSEVREKREQNDLPGALLSLALDPSDFGSVQPGLLQAQELQGVLAKSDAILWEFVGVGNKRDMLYATSFFFAKFLVVLLNTLELDDIFRFVALLCLYGLMLWLQRNIFALPRDNLIVFIMFGLLACVAALEIWSIQGISTEEAARRTELYVILILWGFLMVWEGYCRFYSNRALKAQHELQFIRRKHLLEHLPLPAVDADSDPELAKTVLAIQQAAVIELVHLRQEARKAGFDIESHAVMLKYSQAAKSHMSEEDWWRVDNFMFHLGETQRISTVSKMSNKLRALKEKRRKAAEARKSAWQILSKQRMDDAMAKAQIEYRPEKLVSPKRLEGPTPSTPKPKVSGSDEKVNDLKTPAIVKELKQ